MSWVSRIINGNPDEYVHAKLMKYGIGSHPGPRAKITFSKPSIKFKADLDQEQSFLEAYVIGAPSGQHKIKGMIITYTDRTSDFAKLTMPLSWSKSKGKGAPVFKAKVNESAPLEDIKALFSVDDPTTFYLLSITPRDGSKPWKVATKTSFPKGGPAEEDEESGAKDPVFATGALGNTEKIYEYIIETYLPDVRDKMDGKTKEVWIKNNFEILDIRPPDDPKLSFSEKRRLAKKKGKLLREVVIDGESHVMEYNFVA